MLPTCVRVVVQAGELFVAAFDYDTQDESELSFKKGDKLLITGDTASGGWLKAATMDRSRTGVVPFNYLRECDQASAGESDNHNDMRQAAATEAVIAEARETVNTNRIPQRAPSVGVWSQHAHRSQKRGLVPPFLLPP